MTSERILARNYSVIVFDCDGTLMDTERHWEKAREVVLGTYGVELGEEFAERSKGVHYTECGRLMAEAAGRPELTGEMTERLLASFRELVAGNPLTMPGAAEFVAKTAEFATLAVASNCPHDVVETCLEKAGLISYFAHIVVPGGGRLPKPDPDVYLAASRLCGADTVDCLAVEDSLCGIQSAVRAGMRVIGVGPNPSEESLTLTDLWVASLEDPELVTWADSRPPHRVTPRGSPASAQPGRTQPST